MADNNQNVNSTSELAVRREKLATLVDPIAQEVNGVKHYIFPGGGKRLLFTSKKTMDDCRHVLQDFQPDVIHLHGTEYSIAYSMVKLQPKQPILLTIQGILTRIAQEYILTLTDTAQVTCWFMYRCGFLRAPVPRRGRSLRR